MSITENDETAPAAPASRPHSGLRWLALAGLFMLVGMMVLIFIGRDQSTIVNSPMPELDLKPLSMADTAPTNDQLKGKVVVLHFWGSWCSDCAIEYPEFFKVYEHFKNNPEVAIFSVACEGGSKVELDTLKQESEDFLRKHNAIMPLYADPAVFTRSQITRMLSAGGFAYPSTILVDKSGTVRYLWRENLPSGMVELREKIDDLLKKS
jgi:thiol-disulfide isomerase/thioredoxin